jgi:hypothetical protein
MRNLMMYLVVFLLTSVSLFAQNAVKKYELPELNVIKTVVLSPSYSCREKSGVIDGYGSTALFLSGYAKKRNSPDLLFNGACRADDYFEAATAGDDMSLVADLGANLNLEEISAQRAFNLKMGAPFENYTAYKRNVKTQKNHTYAVLLNESEKRGLFIFTVIDYVPNERVELKYAVKSYQIYPDNPVRSEGFGWGEKSN